MTPDECSRCCHLRRGHRGAVDPKISFIVAVACGYNVLTRSSNEVGLDALRTIAENRQVARAIMGAYNQPGTAERLKTAGGIEGPSLTRIARGGNDEFSLRYCGNK